MSVTETLEQAVSYSQIRETNPHLVWKNVSTSKSKIPATYPNPNVPSTILMQAGRPGERYTLSIAPSGAYLLYRNGVEITLSDL